jgi:hypothetical protein
MVPTSPQGHDARDSPEHLVYACCAANMHRSSSTDPLSFDAAVLYSGSKNLID